MSDDDQKSFLGFATNRDLKILRLHLEQFILNHCRCRHNHCPPGPIRLAVLGVKFIEPSQFGKFNNIMDPNPSNLSIDLPASSGPCVRLPVAPLDKNNKPTPFEPGTLKFTITPADSAQVIISQDEKLVDILLPDQDGATSTVELNADPNLKAGDQGEVITTIITLRRLGVVADEAVTLGVDATKATFQAADQFGVFPTPVLAAGLKKK